MVQNTKLNFIIPWSLGVIIKIRKAICLIGQNILPWSSLFLWNFSRVKDSLINLLTRMCYYLFLLSFPSCHWRHKTESVLKLCYRMYWSLVHVFYPESIEQAWNIYQYMHIDYIYTSSLLKHENMLLYHKCLYKQWVWTEILIIYRIFTKPENKISTSLVHVYVFT